MGIVNMEYREMSYHVVMRVDGVNSDEIGQVVLQHEQECQQEVSFTPEKMRGNQKVEFYLYKNGETEPCLEQLHLWVNVTE